MNNKKRTIEEQNKKNKILAQNAILTEFKKQKIDEGFNFARIL